MKNKAFTLVELIIVITILAILATISFIAFQGFATDSRDSTRLSDMRNIEKTLELELEKAGKVFFPEDSVEISASGTIIAYQGYAGSKVLNNLKVYNGGQDPLDGSYYTYMTNENRTKYQLLGYLENATSFNDKILGQANANNLILRNPKVLGNSLGILLLSGSLLPVQTTGTGVDIVNTNEAYVAYIDNNNVVSGTGSEIYKINPILSYKRIKELNNNSKDGEYLIYPDGLGKMPVYCDMTTDGGGWTLVLKANGNNSTFIYTSDLWTNDLTLNESNYNYDNLEYKNKLFSTMGFSKINFQLVTNGIKKTVTIEKNANSLLEVFNGGEQLTNIGREKWKSLIYDSSLQLHCNKEGFNIQSSINQYAKVRIGIIANNETQCDSADSRLGIGGYGTGCTSNNYNSVGNEGGNCSPDNGEKHFKSLGYLFIK